MGDSLSAAESHSNNLIKCIPSACWALISTTLKVVTFLKGQFTIENMKIIHFHEFWSIL